MLIYLLSETDIPEKLIVELQQNDFLTNTLLILNILVSFSAATFIKIKIDKKAKEFEVKAHIKKITAEKTINFCLRANKTFRNICVKNPKNISSDDINEINNLVVSEEIIFISYDSKQNIINFRDYIISVLEKPEKKNIKKEKSFFFLIEKILNDL